MKNITLIALSVFISSLLTAQTIAFHENFELPSQADSVTSTTTGTGLWGISTKLFNSGLRSDSCVITMGDTNYLTTNAFSTIGNTYVLLEFSQICKIEFFDGAEIEVSNDNGASWTKLTGTHYNGNGQFSGQGDKFASTSYINWLPANNNAIPTNSWWKTETFNISTLVSNSAQVKVRFILKDMNNTGSAGNYGWLLDDIKVTMATSELIPPIISLSAPILNDSVYNLGPFDVYANITDASGIDTAMLIYTRNNGTTDTIGMINTTGNTFFGRIDTIPAFNLFDTACYYIYAKDASPALNSAFEPTTGCHQFVIYTSPPPPNCGTPITSFPLIEDFDAFPTGGTSCSSVCGTANSWTNIVEPSNGTDWGAHSGSTSSSSTGPSSDHTSGSGKYMYTETSGCYNKTANLTSPCLDLTTLSAPKLEFYYHMYGSTMGSLHIDIWYGGQWVNDIWTKSGNQGNQWYKAEINLAPYKSVTKIRFRGLTGTNYYSDMAIDDVKIYEPPANDAGISAITEPISPALVGNQNVKVTVQNYGSASLTQVNIDWLIDGNPQTTFNWTGNIPPGMPSSPITIGQHIFTAGTSVIKAWTSSPNAAVDADNTNDTIQETIVVCASILNGTYTIGGATADFNTFADALNALSVCGLSGPVIFNVNSGTYNEQLNIQQIPGVTETNSVTFQSLSGNPDDVTLTYAITSSSVNYVLYLNGVDHLRFKNMTIKSTGTSYGRVIYIYNNAKDNRFIGNKIIGVSTTGTSANFSLIYSTSGTNSNDSGNVFRLNTFLNGTYGFYYYGPSSSSLEQGTLIDSNQFINQYYRSIQLYYQNAPHVLSNNITSNTAAVHGTSSTYHYAMYLYYCDNALRVLKNKISTPGGTYGIYMSYCDGNLGDEGLIANNFVAEIGGFTFVYGIYTNYCTNQNIYFNNVRITSPTGNAGHAFFLLGGSNIKLANNNLVNTGGAFSLRINTPSALTYSNYNNLYGGLSSSQNFAYWNGTITNFGMWQAATYLDSNSVSMNPQFVSNSDLHVLSASMNNLGSPKGNILDDIDGDVRDLVTPDIGADEFTPNTTDASFSGVFTPTSGCSKTTQEEISLEITNLGIDTINSYNACYVIDGGTPVCEVFNQTILPNSTDTCTFVTKADLSHLGLHSLDFYTNLTGDQNHNNDSIIGHTIFNGHDFYAGDYFTSFEIGDITRGSYSYVDANNDNYYWHFWGNALNSHSGLIYMGYECDQSNTGNDWFLSRCFPFEAGKSYQVEFWYKTSNASYTQKIDVKLGNAKSVSAMTTTIVSLPTITNASFVKKTTQFTIPTTGDYYFGFYAYSPPVTTTAQIFGIIDDFKISLIPPYDAGVVEIPEPLSGCGLTLRSVKINIKNFGTANITGGLTASYRRDSSSTIITETVTNSILSGDTIEFTFSTPIDLSTTIDTAYNITAWTTLTGDTLPATIINDTFTTIVNSYTNPPPPTVFGDTVFSGQSATLIASSPYIHRWYETDTSTNIIFIGDTLLTPVLFDTTVYYVESMNGSSDLKITEVSQYHGYGTGATNPPPSYLLGDDFVEISNLGSVPANLSGYTYHREGLSSSYNITYNFPSVLILNAGEVIVLATQSSGSSNPANNFYVVANYSVSSNTATGHYLTNQQGNIVDAVALNSYSFSTASGITSSDWSGNIPSSSGNAGVVRIISDNDLASDWNISSVTAETLGSINPGISNTSQGNGCTSTKVPVTAIVNLPNIDAGVSDILQPMSLAQSGSSKSVKVIVKNYGLLAITVMDVKYTLNNGTPISYSWSGNLISGQTDTVTFPNFIIPQGAFTICSYTVLTGDQISINDTSIISSIGTQIDSLPYFDNFDTDTIWTTPTTGTTLWQIGIPNYGFTSSAHSLPNAWDINLISAYSANANAILTTQNFDFTNATNAILSFWLNYNTEVNHDGTRMEYSIDNGTNWNVLGSYNDPNGVNWYDIASISSSSLPAWAGNSSGWKKAEYNLSAFNGLPGVKFRFIFTSNSSGFYEGISIDDFEINIPNPIDAGVTNIIQPIAVLNQGVLSPVEVIIKNFGSQAITSMNIIFTLDGTANPPYPWIGNLSPNSTQNVTIANITIPAGNHNLCSYTNLIGDTINYNDTTCTVFYGNPQFDAGVTQIVNPLSTETEGTSIPVKVIIQNFGIDTITNMNIAYKLNSSSPVNTSWSGNLLPNATDTAVLSNILIPPSNNSICAYTLLTSDFNLSNDTSCKTFYGTPLLDIGAESLVYPDTGSCFTPTESVVLKIKNYGSNTINLATNPVTINANVTGVNPYTFTPVIVNTGSINSGATQNVVISSNYNMSIPGVYTFNASLSVVGDGDTTNNFIFPVSMGGVTTIATFPFMENFESGFNSMFLHKINSSSDLTVDSRASNLSNFGLHFQGGNPMGWIGAATGATANQAWNANLAHHAKAVSCNIDATNLNALRLKFDLKQTFSEGQNYSWFRVLANNNYIIEQSGDSIFNPTSSNGDPFEAKYFDLSAYIGSSFTLSFQSSNMRPDQWSSTEGDNAFVDNIILYQPDSLDIGVKSFIQPNQQHAPANTLLSVEVAIENYGYDTITSFSIGYTVAGGPPIIETWNGILYPDSTVTHLFSTQFNVISGNFNICSFTNLTHDGNPGNDTSCIAFLGIPILQLPWSDNFEGTNLWASADGYKQWVRGVPNGNTINIANSPINVWKTNLSGNYYNISDDNLYTPFFNFSNITGATLEFYHWIDSENNYDGGNVQLTKDGGISWTTLGNYADTNGTNWYSNNIGGTHCWSGSGSGWQFSSYNLDTLDNYPTPIQFRYHFFSGAVGNNYDGWAIDDFKIITPPIHKDAGVTTIISPLDSTVVGDNTNVLVTITNFGIDTLYSIPVSFQLNTQTTINETWTGTLLPDSSKNYTFTASYTALNSIYKLCAWTSLTNDIYSVNDSTCKNVGVISAPNDVGFISIIEPDSITPISILTVKATIKNFGTNTITSIPVEYKYGNNTVKETWTGTILPDSTKDYTFSTTYMSPIGSYILCARTKLVGDADSTNDKSCKNISIGINENAIDNFKLLQNVPNPTKGITNIVYIIPNAGKTKFELINLLGEIVYSQENKANAGKNQIEINVRNLPSGMYYYSLKYKGKTLSKKMIIN